MSIRRTALAILGLILAGSAGCKHHGPRSIVADRLPYNEAIAVSWKEQALLNIVKLRYTDTPFFIDVPQITSGYTYQSGATTAGIISPPVNPAAAFAQQLGINFGLQGGYQDRPTISYAPQTGSQFIRNLTTPINPGTVLFMIQSGYPADIVLDLMVESINGVRNRSVSGGELRPADPEFTQVSRTLRKAQIAGGLGIRVERDKDQKESVVFFFQDKTIDPELAQELVAVRKALRIATDRLDFRVTAGSAATSPNELAIQSRSVLRVLTELSVGVEVPGDHLAAGIALPLNGAPDFEPSTFHVHSGCKRPHDPFIAICYESRWFWIEKHDIATKRTLQSVMILLAFADTGAKEALPVITIQAN